jgi:hypothetical protein
VIAIALSIAVVLVALLARDVAVRALAERRAARATPAEIASLSMRIDAAEGVARTEALSWGTASAEDHARSRARIEKLEERVEVLAQKEQLRMLGKRS